MPRSPKLAIGRIDIFAQAARFPMSQNVLIVQPEPEQAKRLGELVHAGTPGATISFATSPEEAIGLLSQFADLALCICELYYPAGGNGLALLAAVRERFRRARIMVVTSYNLQNFGPHLQGLTVFPVPLDESVFISTCQDTLVTLEGQVFPPFRLGKKQPPDRWGDCYAAYDMGVKRDIFITIAHPWATPENTALFRQFAALMARSTHPNVQAVYQAGEYQGRSFFAREKWDMPNLAEMATAGHGIEPRVAAQIIHVVGSVLISWDSQGFPHAPILPTDVTVSPQGVVKIANCVDPTRPVTPPGTADLSALAASVQALIASPENMPPRVANLLAELQRGPVPMGRITGEAQAIDIELAPKQELAVTEEHVVAVKAIAVERRRQTWVLFVGAAALFAVVCVIGYFIYSKFFWEPSAREFNAMAQVPAGPYIYQDGPATMDHSFYIDKYEVTWGQYLRFLKALQKAGSDAAWRSPDQPANKISHEPKDWADSFDAGKRVPGIYRLIRDRRYYHDQILNLDDPVFNVDWYDAYAYAKWAGKRLPTEQEWEMAGRGPNGNLYPWGNTFEPYGNNMAVLPGQPDAPSHVMLVVDQMPQDKSYYGVYDLAGNVSEWTGTIVASKAISSVKVAVIRGANFRSRVADHVGLTYRSTNYTPDTRQYWLGFRCASDTPPSAPAQ
jgi:formylglycine-generating enzyme required for sulfatase activity